MPERGAVGRDAELAEVDAFLLGLPLGSRALSLEGEPGIGKTTLWQEAVRRARQRGMLVLACRPAAAEAKLSFSGLADMLQDVDETAVAALAEPQRHALEVALLRAAPVARPLDPRLVATALLSLVRELARDRPVVLAVDDQQWLDAPTERVIAFTSRRLDREPVGVLCASRRQEDGPDVLAAVERDRVRRLRLGPLMPDDLLRLIADRLERPPPRPLLARIAQASGGSPFYALEVTRLVSTAGGAPGDTGLPVPDDVRALAAERVRGLSMDARAALLRVAVLAAPDTRTVAAADLAAAEEVELVRIEDSGRIEFTHPLFAAAIYGSASSGERRAAHRAAAAVVRDPEQRARHLASGADLPDPAVAAELDDAAALARSRGAPAAAAGLVELALAQTPDDDPDGRAVRLVTAAALHLAAGDPARARTLLAELDERPAPEHVRAEGLRIGAELASRFESFGAAVKIATRALAAAAGDPSAAAGIELDVAFYLVGLGDVGGALRHAEAAVGRAELPGADPGVLGDALAVSTMVAFLSGEGLSEQRLTRALTLERAERPRSVFTAPRFIAGLLLLWSGRLREAVDTLLRLRAERAERGAESDIPTFTLYLVWAYLWLGETERASRLAAADTTAAALLQDRGLTALTLSATALVAAHRGELAAVREQSAAALALFSELEWWTGTVWPRWALGFAELSAGDPAAAHAALAPLTATLPGMGLADPIGLVFLPDEIEALIALGELDRAAPLIDLLHRLGAAHDRAWAIAAAARTAGLLSAARGDLDGAVAALLRALAQHDRVEMPFERGRTLLALGRARRRRKQWGAARTALRGALGLFEDTRAPLWAAAARAELDRAGARGSDPAELTPTERRVAELAASGLTNQEVAERAFLTVKGVEANLTRAYRKLGIRSRVGLARALRSGEDEPVGSG